MSRRALISPANHEALTNIASESVLNVNSRSSTPEQRRMSQESQSSVPRLELDNIAGFKFKDKKSSNDEVFNIHKTVTTNDGPLL